MVFVMLDGSFFGCYMIQWAACWILFSAILSITKKGSNKEVTPGPPWHIFREGEGESGKGRGEGEGGPRGNFFI